jgi:hypothetical protein
MGSVDGGRKRLSPDGGKARKSALLVGVDGLCTIPADSTNRFVAIVESRK